MKLSGFGIWLKPPMLRCASAAGVRAPMSIRRYVAFRTDSGCRDHRWAANKVSAEAREQIPGIAWPAVVGMRDRLVHAYFDVDSQILWTTVEERLPLLLAEVKEVLSRG